MNIGDVRAPTHMPMIDGPTMRTFDYWPAYQQGRDFAELSEMFGRQPGAVESRLFGQSASAPGVGTCDWR